MVTGLSDGLFTLTLYPAVHFLSDVVQVNPLITYNG